MQREGGVTNYLYKKHSEKKLAYKRQVKNYNDSVRFERDIEKAQMKNNMSEVLL